MCDHVGTLWFYAKPRYLPTASVSPPVLSSPLLSSPLGSGVPSDGESVGFFLVLRKVNELIAAVGSNGDGDEAIIGRPTTNAP